MQAEIDELLGRAGNGPSRDRFDPEIMNPKLEAYVEEQVRSVPALFLTNILHMSSS